LQKARYIEINKISEWEAKYLVERRLASPQFIASEMPAMLVVAPQESLSIMVNEEDHLRIQAFEAGLGINDAWKKICALDDQLEENLDYSYSGQFGYVTACPTNIGTGLRVSIFIHLPGLTLRDQVNKVLNQLPISEIAVRGFYGEGSESVGYIFQISNQLTLGRTEKSVIKRMLTVAQDIVNWERTARAEISNENMIKLEDTVYRALGTLQNARIVSSLEAMNLISSVRLGCEVGLIDNISRVELNQLMVLVQPAHLQKMCKQQLTPQERDIFRANFLRERLRVSKIIGSKSI
jgi:protein arginine kinase